MQWPGVDFFEMGHRWRCLTRARWPWAVAALILAIHGRVAWAGGPQAIPQWYWVLGLRREAVLAGGIWQLLSYALLHGSWAHALINALWVLVLGSRVEQILGPGGFCKTLAAGIAGGALGHLALTDGSNAAFPLVGVSGGCVALLLVITTLSPQSRMFPLPLSGRSLGLGILIAELAFALIDPKLALPGLAALGRALAAHGFGNWFSVGHACHVGGGVAGYWYGRWILRPGPTLSRLRQERHRREARQRPPG